MTEYIQTGDYHVNPVRGEVRCGDQLINIRPKSFDLLLLLLEARGGLVSKQEILNKVWGDVSVNEQVIFQSIKELRKAFQSTNPIKTVPRQGYAWILPVAISVTSPQQPTPTHALPKSKSRKPLHILWGMALVLGIAASFMFWKQDKTLPPTGAVIVLPVKNMLTDTDHRWVRYGAMDHLIHRLQASDTHIYQTVDVMEVMKRAGISSESVTRTYIDRLFEVTGTTLVVELTLAGTPREYQLLYSFHERTDTEKGVLLDNRVEGALDSLATVIGQRMGQPGIVADKGYSSEFANEMIATALESMQADDFTSAEKLLDAAVATEPNNIAAKRLLAQSLIQQTKFEKTKTIIAEAISQAETTDDKHELVRLNFWAGINEFQNRNHETGLNYLTHAAVYANAIKDWLYLGYIAEVRGHIQHSTGDYALAKQLYETAIEHHRTIQCPYGQAQGFLNLARVAADMGDWSSAFERTEASLAVIQERQLSTLEDAAESWQKTLIDRAPDAVN